MASSQEKSSRTASSPPTPQEREARQEVEQAVSASAATLESHGNDEDDEFELDFGFPREGSDSTDQLRQVFRSDEYRRLFHLPPDEVLVQDFNCALQKKILLQGHMYLFEHYVCFYSNIFGYEKKKVILLKDVTCVRKAKTAGLFPNAIEIVAWGKKNFFASFLSRDEAYRLIVEGWARHCKYARLLTDSQATQDQHDASFSESSFGSRDIVEVPAERHSKSEHGPGNGGEACDRETSGIERSNVENAAEIMDGPKCSAANNENLWDVEDGTAPEVPAQYKTILDCELPVDVKDFFYLFFSNDSVKFCETFHKKCGDEDFQCTNWAKHRHFGHVRDVSFKHPIKFYFGPKAAYCQEVQRFHVYQNSHLIVETSQQMNDIPYGDHFRVEGLWQVTPLTGRSGPHCSVHVFVYVSFSKKTVWKGKIEQGTYDECKEVFSAWLAEASKALQERGMTGDKPAKLESTSQVSPGHPHSVSSKFQKLKRKLEAGYRHSQAHTQMHKLSKGKSNSTEGQTFKSAEKVDQISNAANAPKHQQQQEVRGDGPRHTKLIVALCVMAIILFIQAWVIIALTKPQRLHYIIPGMARDEEHCKNQVRHCLRRGQVWIEENHVQFLEEEISIAEARLQIMQDTLEHLKSSLKSVKTSSETSFGDA